MRVDLVVSLAQTPASLCDAPAASAYFSTKVSFIRTVYSTILPFFTFTL